MIISCIESATILIYIYPLTDNSLYIEATFQIKINDLTDSIIIYLINLNSGSENFKELSLLSSGTTNLINSTSDLKELKELTL